MKWGGFFGTNPTTAPHDKYHSEKPLEALRRNRSTPANQTLHARWAAEAGRGTGSVPGSQYVGPAVRRSAWRGSQRSSRAPPPHPTRGICVTPVVAGGGAGGVHLEGPTVPWISMVCGAQLLGRFGKAWWGGPNPWHRLPLIKPCLALFVGFVDSHVQSQDMTCNLDLDLDLEPGCGAQCIAVTLLFLTHTLTKLSNFGLFGAFKLCKSDKTSKKNLFSWERAGSRRAEPPPPDHQPAKLGWNLAKRSDRHMS